MNILEIEDDLKNLSDGQLQGAMKSGSAPQFLVLSEMQRRKTMRDKYGAQGQQPPKMTIAEEMMGGIAAKAPGMNYSSGGIVGFAEGGDVSDEEKAVERFAKGLEDASYENDYTGRKERPPRKPDVRKPRKLNVGGFIAEQESFRPEAYWDSGQWSIGYGTPSKEGEVIDEAEARRRMDSEIAKAEENVDRLVDVDLAPNQRDAVVSLMYNIGPTQFAESTAREKLNQGDFEGFAYEAFDPEQGFVKGERGGDPLPGLVKRRGKEREMFLASSQETPGPVGAGGESIVVAKAKEGEQPRSFPNEPVPEERQAPKVTAAEGIAGLQQARAPVDRESGGWFDYIKGVLNSQVGNDDLPPALGGRQSFETGGRVLSQEELAAMTPRERAQYEREKRQSRSAEEQFNPSGGTVEGTQTRRGERDTSGEAFTLTPELETKSGIEGYGQGSRRPTTTAPGVEGQGTSSFYGAPGEEPEKPAQSYGVRDLWSDIKETGGEALEGTRGYLTDTVFPYWDERLNFSGTQGDGGDTQPPMLPETKTGAEETAGAAEKTLTTRNQQTDRTEPPMTDEAGKVTDEYIDYLKKEAEKGPTGQQKLGEFLMNTGIGMMASNSPSTLRNLGLGGVQGLKALKDMEAGEAERQANLQEMENLYRRTQMTNAATRDRSVYEARQAFDSYNNAVDSWAEQNTISLSGLSAEEYQQVLQQAMTPGSELYSPQVAEAYQLYRVARARIPEIGGAASVMPTEDPLAGVDIKIRQPQ